MYKIDRGGAEEGRGVFQIPFSRTDPRFLYINIYMNLRSYTYIYNFSYVSLWI